MTDETQEQQITAVGNEMSASFLAAAIILVRFVSASPCRIAA